MNATEILVEEHRLIVKVLDSLEAYAFEAEPRDSAGRDDAALFVQFLREFADACHHAKEENVLFAAMADAGFPSDSGPLAVMHREHAQGRRLVRQMRELAERPGAWSVEDRQSFAGAVRAYAELLRAHIRKEDDVLYPMAEAHLTKAQLDRVEEQYEAFERSSTGPGEHERLHALAEALIEKYPAGGGGARAADARRPSCCGL